MTGRKTVAPLDLESFKKVLELEESKGHNDTAVIGGLDRFIEPRKAELKALTDGEAQGLLKISYSGLTPSQRREWVSVWLATLEHKLQVSGQPLPSAVLKSTPNTRKPATRPKSAKKGVTQSERSLDSPVTMLKGVEAKTSAKLGRLGVTTIRDILYLFPRRHNDFSQVSKISQLEPGKYQTVAATVWELREIALGRGRIRATEAVVSDETGNIKVIWFGQRYLTKVLRPNTRVALSGRVDLYRDRLQFQSPEFEVLDQHESLIRTARLVPVYPLTEGLTPRRLRGIVSQAIEEWLPHIEDPLPDATRASGSFPPLAEAIRSFHYPDDLGSRERSRRRLAFDELFHLQLVVLMRKMLWQEALDGVPVPATSDLVDKFMASLPFSLTEAQTRCLSEVTADINRGTPPMNRLLQGEVGSGKTIVALAALLATAAAGYQGSIMVPTEVLAEQHFATISNMLSSFARPVQEDNVTTVYIDPHPKPISVGLLTGSTKVSVRRELLKRASEGFLDIIVGTHALIQEGVDMDRLALAVVDEQHRFGVMQRAALREKGGVSPHVLVMSATPIPRTLTLTLYGDLDISTIDQLPPGRQQILTRFVPPDRREGAYGFVRKQVREGRQAFVICPLIDESEAIEARAATEEYERLSRDVFPDLRLGLLHGRMAARDKDKVMRQFRDGELDILVSTAVVEVGIDIPNATVMVVEGAHRFGLAQLHQFRGRVGRGEHKSYCLLLSDDPSPEARERLSAVERVHDGFQLAEVDLELRGPGDVFGTRQSGLPNFRVARLSDQDLLKLARDEAAKLLEDDPGLQKPVHKALVEALSRLSDRVNEEVS